MRVLQVLPKRRPTLSAEAEAAVREWQHLPNPRRDALLDETRWVVIDVETSGLDPFRDSLISVGAVAVRGTHLVLEDSFEVILQQERTSSTENILLHGIGSQAQVAGTPPAQALIALLRFLRKDPLVAFHASFDRTVLTRAFRRFLGLKFRLSSYDLAYLCLALFSELASKYQGLDDWLTHFGIPDFARHNALSDALSTAQVFLIALGKAKATGITRCRDLEKLERTGRQVPERKEAFIQVSG
jgi:DNA polymerase-3 subunit epsilon